MGTITGIRGWLDSVEFPMFEEISVKKGKADPF